MYKHFLENYIDMQENNNQHDGIVQDRYVKTD